MHSWSLRSRWARSVREVAPSALWWGTGLATYSLLLTALLPQVQENLSALLADLAGKPLYGDVIQRITRGGDVAANDGLQRGRVLALLGVSMAALAAAVVRFELKDLVR